MLGNDLIYRRRLRCFANIIRDGSDIGAAVVIEVLAELRQGMRYLEGIDLAAWRQLRSQYGIAPCACAHVENCPRRLDVFDEPPFRLKSAFPVVVRKFRVVGDQLNGRATGDDTIDWSYYWLPDGFHWKGSQLEILPCVSECRYFSGPGGSPWSGLSSQTRSLQGRHACPHLERSPLVSPPVCTWGRVTRFFKYTSLGRGSRDHRVRRDSAGAENRSLCRL